MVRLRSPAPYGGIPERPKGADCKSVVTDFGGPNPPSPTKNRQISQDACRFLFVFFFLPFALACPCRFALRSVAVPSLHFALCSVLHMPCLFFGLSAFFRVSDGCFLPFDIGMQGARHRGYRGQNHRLEPAAPKIANVCAKTIDKRKSLRYNRDENGRKGFVGPTKAHGCH